MQKTQMLIARGPLLDWLQYVPPPPFAPAYTLPPPFPLSLLVCLFCVCVRRGLSILADGRVAVYKEGVINVGFF
jgi:hypothetical protein